MFKQDELEIFSSNLTLLCIQNERQDIHALLDPSFARVDCFESLQGIEECFHEHRHDIVIIDIDIPTRDVLKKLKGASDDIFVIVLSEYATFEKMKNMINLGVDACVSKPCVESELFEALLKASEKVYYKKYLFEEKELDVAPKVAPKESVQVTADNDLVKEDVLEVVSDEKLIVLDHEANERIRYSIKDKIDAIDFVENLLPEDVERISDFNEEMDSFYATVDGLMDQNAQMFYTKTSFLGGYFNNFYHIINNMKQFPVMAEAFRAFGEFFYGITEDDLVDREKNNLLVESLLGLIGDLNAWADNIFTMQNTNNVNYLDASFANVCIEIEAAFKGKDIVTEDNDDDLEFF